MDGLWAVGCLASAFGIWQAPSHPSQPSSPFSNLSLPRTVFCNADPARRSRPSLWSIQMMTGLNVKIAPHASEIGAASLYIPLRSWLVTRPGTILRHYIHRIQSAHGQSQAHIPWLLPAASTLLYPTCVEQNLVVTRTNIMDTIGRLRTSLVTKTSVRAWEAKLSKIGSGYDCK